MALVHCAAKFEVVIMHVEKKRMENTDGCKLYSWTTSIYHATMGTVLAANVTSPATKGPCVRDRRAPRARARSHRRFKMQKWPLFLSFPVRPCERYWHRPEREGSRDGRRMRKKDLAGRRQRVRQIVAEVAKIGASLSCSAKKSPSGSELPRRSSFV